MQVFFLYASHNTGYSAFGVKETKLNKKEEQVLQRMRTADFYKLQDHFKFVLSSEIQTWFESKSGFSERGNSRSIFR